MKRLLPALLFLLTAAAAPASGQYLLVYMDLEQTDHLKAYGLAYYCLETGRNVEWLLNYRGGSFLLPDFRGAREEAALRGVVFEPVDVSRRADILAVVAESNMEMVLLEKEPAIAVYAPPNTEPWDDAVTLALTYADVPFTQIWDGDVLAGDLENYDWLHLHHEDFTGQFNKFYVNYRNSDWYRQDVALSRSMAERYGFAKVSELKRTVAVAIKDYVLRGGFLFAMCLAAETLDIALAAAQVDIVAEELDGDPADPNAQARLNYSQAMAFTGFRLEMNPMINSFSDIDVNQVNNPNGRVEVKDFTLFEFSAKYDPVPAMLTQNHVAYIRGFYGQTTTYRRSRIKDYVTILAEVEGLDRVRYLHGNLGRGSFTFFGGHDPEDPQHKIGERPTNLALYKNSPGYRLILNNILFPAARRKEHKT